MIELIAISRHDFQHIAKGLVHIYGQPFCHGYGTIDYMLGIELTHAVGNRFLEKHLYLFRSPSLLNCLRHCSHCTCFPSCFRLCFCRCEHSSVTALLYTAFHPGLDALASLFHLSSRIGGGCVHICTFKSSNTQYK